VAAIALVTPVSVKVEQKERSRRFIPPIMSTFTEKNPLLLIILVSKN